jgi:hypothetical protein
MRGDHQREHHTGGNYHEEKPIIGAHRHGIDLSRRMSGVESIAEEVVIAFQDRS